MSIQCDDARLFLDPFLDGELDPAERAAFEAHFEGCDACGAELARQASFRAKLRASCAEVSEAPEALRRTICTALRSECAQKRAARRRRTARRAAWAAAPLAAAAAAVVVVPTLTVAPAASTEASLVAQTLDWHRGDFPLEVRTNKPEHVSRWFRGKVGFPVRLPTFDDARTELVGARIAHVHDRRAAYALYELSDGSRMSVMMFPGQGLNVSGDMVREVGGRDVALATGPGYDVAVVQDGGVTYAVTAENGRDRLVEILGSALAK